MATTVATPEKASMHTGGELYRESPVSNSSASSGCTVDLDKAVAGSSQAQHSIGSLIQGNDCLTGSVSCTLFYPSRSSWQKKSHWSDDSNGDDLVFTQRLHAGSQKSEVMVGIRLVRWKWLEMIVKRDTNKTAHQDASKLQAAYTVGCECGFGGKEGTMVRPVTAKSKLDFIDSEE